MKRLYDNAEERLADAQAELAVHRSKFAAAEARIVELERERDAYKRAKAENDDRFMRERDEARARAAALDGRRREGRQLLRRMVKYCREDRATTERATRLARLVAQVDDYLARTGEPADILRGES